MVRRIDEDLEYIFSRSLSAYLFPFRKGYESVRHRIATSIWRLVRWLHCLGPSSPTNVQDIVGHLAHVWSHGVREVVSSNPDRDNIVGWVFHPTRWLARFFLIWICLSFQILNLFRTLSSWGSIHYRPSAPLLYEVASHVKKKRHSGQYYYYYYYYYYRHSTSPFKCWRRVASNTSGLEDEDVSVVTVDAGCEKKIPTSSLPVII